MQNKVFLYILSAMSLGVVSCQDKTKSTDIITVNNAIEEEDGSSQIGVAVVSDFIVVANIDDYREAKFSVDPHNAPFVIYTKADLNSKSMSIPVSPQNRFGSLYVFGESEDFYEVHYQLVNDPRTTVRAFVPKSLFTKDSHQQIKNDTDLHAVRSLTIKGEDVNSKSFDKYGTVSFGTEDQYKTAISKYKLLIEPNAAVVEDKKRITIKTVKGDRILEKNSFDEGVQTDLTLIGYNAYLNKVIVKEVVEMQYYYALYPLESIGESPIIIGGLPKLSPNKKHLIGLQNSFDVGIDFSLWSIDLGNLDLDTYANFSEFKLFSENSYAWLDDDTIVLKVLHANSLNTVTIREETDVKPQYVKIDLK